MGKCDICGKNGPELSLLGAEHKEMGHIHICSDCWTNLYNKNACNAEADPENRRTIYESTYWEIHERLGSGSIGPATSVASGLMEQKKEELADVLGIKIEDRIY